MIDFDLPALPDKYVIFGLGVLTGIAFTVLVAFIWVNLST